MSRLNLIAVSLIALLGLSIATFAQDDAQVVDRVIAVVDDEIILESEVMQFVQDIAVREPERYQSMESIVELREQILQELITQKILLAAAIQDTNVVVEDREVDMTLDDRLSSVISQVGGEDKLEAYYGKPIRQIRRDYRKQVRESLLVDRLRSQKMMNVSVNRSEVEAFYERNKDQLPQVPQQTDLAHILVEIAPDEEAQETAKALADSLFTLLIIGEEFADLAMEYSDDAASGAKGGLLGATERGDLVPAYEEVAYALEEGEISEPVLSRFGYHIIKLNWRRGEKINTSHILIKLAPSQTDEQRALQKITRIRESIINTDTTFSEAANLYSDDDETASIGGDLGVYDQNALPDDFRFIVKELEEGDISNPFKSRFGYQILHLKERTEERTMSLLKDWDRLRRMALMEKQDQVFREWVDSLREDVYIEVMDEEE